jgi:hypothetical protein
VNDVRKRSGLGVRAVLRSLALAIFAHDATATMGVLLLAGARLQPAPTAAPRQAPALTLGDQRIREREMARPEPQAAASETRALTSGNYPEGGRRRHRDQQPNGLVARIVARRVPELRRRYRPERQDHEPAAGRSADRLGRAALVLVWLVVALVLLTYLPA